jgi:hypothetical protein
MQVGGELVLERRSLGIAAMLAGRAQAADHLALGSSQPPSAHLHDGERGFDPRGSFLKQAEPRLEPGHHEVGEESAIDAQRLRRLGHRWPYLIAQVVEELLGEPGDDCELGRTVHLIVTRGLGSPTPYHLAACLA